MSNHGYVRSSATTIRLFTPAILLPEQTVLASSQSSSPEHRLLIALLADAIYCFHHAANARLARDAERWLMYDQHPGPFSFDAVCFFLGLNACAVRSRLRTQRLTRRAINAIS